MESLMVHRNTRQRKMILMVVEELDCHPTADQVFDAVRMKLPHTSLSTVYRNLGILVDRGELIAVRGAGRKIHYDHKTVDHNHIKCSICGIVFDINIDSAEIDSLKSKAISGFIINEVYLNIVGICPECAGKLKKEELR